MKDAVDGARLFVSAFGKPKLPIPRYTACMPVWTFAHRAAHRSMRPVNGTIERGRTVQQLSANYVKISPTTGTYSNRLCHSSTDLPAAFARGHACVRGRSSAMWERTGPVHRTASAL